MTDTLINEPAPLVTRPMVSKIARAADTLVTSAAGIDAQFLLGAAETGGQFSIASMVVAPNAGPPPHIHAVEDELWFIMEGRFEFLIGEDVVEVGPGDVVFTPKNVVHTFRNCGDAPGRFLNLATGPTFDIFLDQWNRILEQPVPDFGAAAAVAAEYGITILAPRNA